MRAAFPGHSVSTVSEAGWRGSKDDSLLRLAERGFDAFLTIDRGIEHQVDLRSFALGFVIVSRNQQYFGSVSSELRAIIAGSAERAQGRSDPPGCSPETVAGWA